LERFNEYATIKFRFITFAKMDLAQIKKTYLLELEKELKKVPEGLHWRAPEFEVVQKSWYWYLLMMLFLLGIVTYALFVDSPIMAITFILVGIVGYLHLQKQPRILDFKISGEGVQAGRDFYDFENVESFWIFYHPSEIKSISLRTKNSVIPFVHIPLGDQDPVVARDFLTRFLKEKKQTPSFVNALERLFHV